MLTETERTRLFQWREMALREFMLRAGDDGLVPMMSNLARQHDFLNCTELQYQILRELPVEQEAAFVQFGIAELLLRLDERLAKSEQAPS